MSKLKATVSTADLNITNIGMASTRMSAQSTIADLRVRHPTLAARNCTPRLSNKTPGPGLPQQLPPIHAAAHGIYHANSSTERCVCSSEYHSRWCWIGRPRNSNCTRPSRPRGKDLRTDSRPRRSRRWYSDPIQLNTHPVQLRTTVVLRAIRNGA